MRAGSFHKAARIALLLAATVGVLAPTDLLADERIKAEDGREFVLKSDGTYEAVKAEPVKSDEPYKVMKLTEVKLDIDRMKGQRIEAEAYLSTFGDMVMIGNLSTKPDFNPIAADQSQLSRAGRRFILERCNEKCPVIIQAEVGDVFFQNGLILHSVKSYFSKF